MATPLICLSLLALALAVVRRKSGPAWAALALFTLAAVIQTGS